MSKVQVVPYDVAWPTLFEELRAGVATAVQDIAITIQHVGSTSVPGLLAKPIIDMDIVVPDEQVSDTIRALQTLGYEHRGIQGVPGREAFRAPALTPAHHVYVCGVNSPALAQHLAVRDYLRANAEALAEYAALKSRLALEFPNEMEEYIEGKTAFLVGILRTVGFDERALQDIVQMNRRASRPHGNQQSISEPRRFPSAAPVQSATVPQPSRD